MEFETKNHEPGRHDKIGPRGEKEHPLGQPSKRQLHQGILTPPVLVSGFLILVFLFIFIIFMYLVWRRRNGQKKQKKLRRKAMVKLPMLLSKPKKDYKSVSKTELLKEPLEDADQEDNPGEAAVNIYDEIQEVCEKEPEDCIGKLEASLKYENSCLRVSIERYSDFTFANPEESEDIKRHVTIKLDMAPDEHSAKTSTVITNTQVSEFNQELSFKNIHYNRFEIMSLQFKILIDDKTIGEVSKEISKIDRSNDFSEPVALALPVSPVAVQEEYQGCGELLMSLCHQPAAKRLSVVILKARNVPKMDITGFSDPYVKIYLHHQNNRSAKKKTHIKKRSLNPVFNESFIFDLPTKDGSLGDVQLEVIMCDWDRITKNEVIGSLVLSCESEDATALAHWQEIQKSPRRPIAQWHKLSHH